MSTQVSSGFRQNGWSRWPLLAFAALVASLVLLAADRLMVPEHFGIGQVQLINDGQHVRVEHVQQAIDQLGQHSWFSIDLEEVEQSVESVPWVYRAHVRRQWPSTLIVTVEEARPAASWNQQQWLNQQGEILVMPDEYRAPLLPRLNGADGHEVELMNTYRELAEWFPRETWQIQSLTQNPRGSWQLTLRIDGRESVLPVTLGKEQIQQRFKRFCQAMAQRALHLDQRIGAVDLRYSNGFAILWNKTEDEEKYMARGEQTATAAGKS